MCACWVALVVVRCSFQFLNQDLFEVLVRRPRVDFGQIPDVLPGNFEDALYQKGFYESSWGLF
jgi:hypothetical protein